MLVMTCFIPLFGIRPSRMPDIQKRNRIEIAVLKKFVDTICKKLIAGPFFILGFHHCVYPSLPQPLHRQRNPLLLKVHTHNLYFHHIPYAKNLQGMLDKLFIRNL